MLILETVQSPPQNLYIVNVAGIRCFVDAVKRFVLHCQVWMAQSCITVHVIGCKLTSSERVDVMKLLYKML